MVRELFKLEDTYQLSNGSVFHYTCNAPSQKVLDDYGISAIGGGFDRDAREFLLIPSEVFEKKGIPIPEDKNILTIEAENLLRRLE